MNAKQLKEAEVLESLNKETEMCTSAEAVKAYRRGLPKLTNTPADYYNRPRPAGFDYGD
jgi:hypothetical protein